MRLKWCGVASAVTGSPSALARRTSATLPAVDRCRKCARAPVSRTSSMSRCTISSSAIDGHPGRPSRLQHDPSCITAPSVRRATSQCWASVMPSPPEYSNARRMRSGSCTPLPSSVKIRTPIAASSANGASWVPFRPTVIAAAGSTSHSPARAACCRTKSTTSTQSCVGSVFGIATIAVKPPRAAARLPVSIVSASSLPGSRRCACRSTNPGLTTHPDASITSSPSAAARPSPTSAMRPSTTRTSPARSPVWSSSRPPVIRMRRCRRWRSCARLPPGRSSTTVRRRAGRTAPPSARRCRWSPAG